MGGRLGAQDREAYRYLARSLYPRRWVVAGVLALIVVTSTLEGASYGLIVPVVQMLTGPSQNGPSAVETGAFGIVRRLLAPYPVPLALAFLGSGLVGLFALKNALQYLRGAVSARLWIGISAETRRRAFAQTLDRPYGYFLDNKQGRLVELLYHEPNHFSYAVQTAIEQLSNVLTMLVLLGLLVVVSWKVTLLLAAFGLVYAGVMAYFSRLTHADGPVRQEAEGEALAILAESIAGIRQLKLFSATTRVRDLYGGAIQRLQSVLTRHWIISLLPARINEVFWVGVLGLLLCLPALGLIEEPRAIMPVLALSAAIGFRVGPYFSQMGQGWLTFKFFLPAARAVAELVASGESDRMPGAGRVPFSGLRAGIRFEGVSFAYGRGAPALREVTFEVREGEMTAIVGPSGAGKSTLADLLIRFYEPDEGRIVVDGLDLRDYDRESWLGAIGFVSQDTFVFHGTVGENIALSRAGATREEIVEAAKKANAHGFIERLPHGYDTVVGDRGLKLSGGERQRLAIARALLRDPEILIFDEATSALDTQSEAEVRTAMELAARGRTVIVIAHRLSTVVRADRIVVLDGGRVVEEGRHTDLVSRKGLYAALYAPHP